MFPDFLDTSTEMPLPPKLSELMADSWDFPTTFPVVSDAHSPDSERTLKEVIEYSVTEYYKDHRISVYDQDLFTQRLTVLLYNKMTQHQYWIDEFLGLIDDAQFFYNDEWNDGGTQTSENIDRSTNSASDSLDKSMDTPQNITSDIEDHLSSAEKGHITDVGTEDVERTNNFTTNLHVKRSTLGNITEQFKNFAGFPSFIEQIIEAVKPAFMLYYGDEDIDYGAIE